MRVKILSQVLRTRCWRSGGGSGQALQHRKTLVPSLLSSPGSREETSAHCRSWWQTWSWQRPPRTGKPGFGKRPQLSTGTPCNQSVSRPKIGPQGGEFGRPRHAMACTHGIRVRPDQRRACRDCLGRAQAAHELAPRLTAAVAGQAGQRPICCNMRRWESRCQSQTYRTWTSFSKPTEMGRVWDSTAPPPGRSCSFRPQRMVHRHPVGIRGEPTKTFQLVTHNGAAAQNHGGIPHHWPHCLPIASPLAAQRATNWGQSTRRTISGSVKARRADSVMVAQTTGRGQAAASLAGPGEVLRACLEACTV